MTFGIHSVSVVLVLVAFVFLLLATISAPVVKSFGLGQADGTTFGIFGSCAESCTKATYPYTVSGTGSGWLLNDSMRDTLAKIFIVAPIALGLNFIVMLLAVGAHFHTGVFVVALVGSIIAFLATALIAVIVVIVFHPHVMWTGWILIGAAAADLVAVLLLVLGLVFSASPDDDEDESLSDLTRFDSNKYEKVHGFTTTLDKDEKYGDYNGYRTNLTGFSGPAGYKAPETAAPANVFGTPTNNFSAPSNAFTTPTNGLNATPPSTNYSNGSAVGSNTSVPSSARSGTAFNVTPSYTSRLTGPQPMPKHVPPPISTNMANRYQVHKTISNSSMDHANPQTVSDMTVPNSAVYASSSYYDNSVKSPTERVSIAESPTTPRQIKTQMAPNLVPASATQFDDRLPYPAGSNPSLPSTYNTQKYAGNASFASRGPGANPEGPYPTGNSYGQNYPNYPQSVFTHHPEVEGHKPFTELDDKDEENYDFDKKDDSDTESDFTSVSQRAPNPMYSQGYQGQPQGYQGPPNQGYQGPPQGYQGPPQGYQGPPQGYNQGYQGPQGPRYPQGQGLSGPVPPGPAPGPPSNFPPNRPTVSNAVMQANPDINFGMKRNPKSSGVAKNAAASSLMGRGRNGPYGAI